MKKQYFIFIVFLFYNFAIFPERFSLQTELDQVNFLDQLLSSSENLRLQVIDDFETNKYFIFDPPTPLHQLEIVYKNPGLSYRIEQKRAFELEQVLVGGWGNTNSFDKSLMFYYNVDIPGRQHFRIIPKESIYITGQPIRYSIWIHSKNYSDKFFLVFKTGSKEIKVFVSLLNWKGWKRIENSLPKNFFYLPKLNKPAHYYQFKGFFIQTTRKSETGNREILLDHFLIVTDIQKLQYPGAEILDNF
ncbi:MAG: hypothetical protein KatS3mg129_0153 [Leptospiraceae bacterium]|nr:MAG: hypothetical protein KatS3mg129_0153 [Leptospiraceae bacterium]